MDITCCKCKKPKDESSFPWKNTAKGIRQPYCKECKKEYNKVWYSKKENVDNQKRRVNENKRKYLARTIEWKAEYVKSRGGCSYDGCEVDNPIMIDFDHIDPSTKDFDLSYMGNKGFPIKRLEEEAAKCRLLCANHHRLRTAEQFGWLVFTQVSALPPKE